MGAKSEMVPVKAVVLPFDRTTLALCSIGLLEQEMDVDVAGVGAARITNSTNRSVPKLGSYVKGTVRGIFIMKVPAVPVLTVTGPE